MRERLAPGGATVRVVWGDDARDAKTDAVESLLTPSLFGGPSVLVVRRAEALAADEEASLLALLSRLGTAARLVLVARVLDQRRKLHAACAKAGVAVGFARPDPRATATWILTLARERGHRIAAPAVERLLERVGADLGRLDAELEKLSIQVGPGNPIEVATVEAGVAALRQHAVEELTDRLARRDVTGAIRSFRGLVASGEPPIRIVAFLAANLRRALHVAELHAHGLREEEIATRLGMPAWLVAKQARRGTPADLERALDALAALDVALKSSRPEEPSFERTLLAIGGSASAVSR